MRSRARATVGLLASAKRSAVGKSMGRTRTSAPKGEGPKSAVKPGGDFPMPVAASGSFSFLAAAGGVEADCPRTVPAQMTQALINAAASAVGKRHLSIRGLSMGAPPCAGDSIARHPVDWDRLHWLAIGQFAQIAVDDFLLAGQGPLYFWSARTFYDSDACQLLVVDFDFHLCPVRLAVFDEVNAGRAAAPVD